MTWSGTPSFGQMGTVDLESNSSGTPKPWLLSQLLTPKSRTMKYLLYPVLISGRE